MNSFTRRPQVLPITTVLELAEKRDEDGLPPYDKAYNSPWYDGICFVMERDDVYGLLLNRDCRPISALPALRKLSELEQKYGLVP